MSVQHTSNIKNMSEPQITSNMSEPQNTAMNIPCVLNEKGLECYENNRDSKIIPPHHNMMIMRVASYDSGQEIYLIRSTTDPSLTDYYYADNLLF